MSLPRNWSYASIFEISTPKQWKTVSKKELVNKGYPVYGANGVIGYYNKYTHSEPTLMITCRGASCGNVHKSVPQAYINGNAMSLDNLSNKIEINYLYYFLKFTSFREVISGSAQPQITQEGLQKLRTLIPPLNEQKRIANKLDQLFTEINKANQHLQQIPHILKRFRQSVLQAATSGELTKDWRKKTNTNYHWESIKLSDMGNLSRGKSKHRPRNDSKLFGNKYPFIQTGEIANSGGVINSATKFYSDFGLQQSKLFSKGTLCITIAANIADTAILNIDACFPDSVIGFNLKNEKYNILFVKYLIDINKSKLEMFASSTAQKNINLRATCKIN